MNPFFMTESADDSTFMIESLWSVLTHLGLFICGVVGWWSSRFFSRRLFPARCLPKKSKLTDDEDNEVEATLDKQAQCQDDEPESENPALSLRKKKRRSKAGRPAGSQVLAAVDSVPLKGDASVVSLEGYEDPAVDDASGEPLDDESGQSLDAPAQASPRCAPPGAALGATAAAATSARAAKILAKKAERKARKSAERELLACVPAQVPDRCVDEDESPEGVDKVLTVKEGELEVELEVPTDEPQSDELEDNDGTQDAESDVQHGQARGDPDRSSEPEEEEEGNAGLPSATQSDTGRGAAVLDNSWAAQDAADDDDFFQFLQAATRDATSAQVAEMDEQPGEQPALRKRSSTWHAAPVAWSSGAGHSEQDGWMVPMEDMARSRTAPEPTVVQAIDPQVHKYQPIMTPDGQMFYTDGQNFYALACAEAASQEMITPVVDPCDPMHEMFAGLAAVATVASYAPMMYPAEFEQPPASRPASRKQPLGGDGDDEEEAQWGTCWDFVARR